MTRSDRKQWGEGESERQVKVASGGVELVEGKRGFLSPIAYAVFHAELCSLD